MPPCRPANAPRPSNHHARWQGCVPGAARLLAAARAAGLPVVHTLEAHRPDLSDLPQSKRCRGNLPEHLRIGAAGAMGRILVAGEEGEPAAAGAGATCHGITAGRKPELGPAA